MAEAGVADPVIAPARDSVAPLDVARILARLEAGIRDVVELRLLDETGSTNDDILSLPAESRHGRVVLAERQLAGKGRRGRRWLSPPGNIWFSLGWRFATAAENLESLGLVTAIATCRALSSIGLEGHGIKWPNDIQLGGAKLAGILVESARTGGGADAVIGIGINVQLDDAASAAIDQPPTDLSSHLGPGTVDRNRVVAALIDELVTSFSPGPEQFAEILENQWPHWDLLSGTTIEVSMADRSILGMACGITPAGALKVRVEGSRGMAVVHSGEVSVRSA